MRPEIFLARKGFRTFTMKRTFKRHCERLATKLKVKKSRVYSEHFLNQAYELMMGR